MLLRAIGEFFGAPVSIVDAGVLAERPAQVVPLLGRYGARCDDIADDARAETVAVLPLQVDERERHFAFPEIASDWLSHSFSVTGVIKQIVDQLERDAEIETVLAKRVLVIFRDAAEEA